MAIFSKIEVHFRDPAVGMRRVVIRPRKGIQALFLEGSERRLLPRKQAQPIIPTGVSLVPRGKTARGPGGVCYLENGILKCWNPD